MPNWIPKRSLTLLAGREGLGKSTIACLIAAEASTGKLTGKPMNVAYLATEDSLSLTVAPRLKAAGADMEKVFSFQVTTPEGGAGALSLPGDIQALEKALVEKNVGLVILDAAKSAMHGSLNGFRDDDVRRFLDPLAAMCDRCDLAVVGLVHFGKQQSADSGKLILGSIAWSQVARSVLSVAQDMDSGGLVVTNTKSNLASRRVSREVHLESVLIRTDDGGTTEVGRAVLGDETNVSAADLLAVAEEHGGRRTQGEEWLQGYLTEHGATPRGDVLEAAREAGIGSERTVERAFKKMGGVSKTKGFPPVAMWSLPGDSTVTASPYTCESDGIDGIGRDLGRRNDENGEISHYRHEKKNDGNGDGIGEQPGLEPETRLVLDALSEDHGLTLNGVKASLPKRDRENLAGGSRSTEDQEEALRELLQQLEERGLVERDGEKFLKSRAVTSAPAHPSVAGSAGLAGSPTPPNVAGSSVSSDTSGLPTPPKQPANNIHYGILDYEDAEDFPERENTP